MKRKFLSLIICLAFFAAPLLAQDKIIDKIAVGAGLGFCRLTGDLGEQGGLGLTYGLEGKYFLTEKFAAGLLFNRNGLIYKADDNFLSIGNYGNLQVMALAEYFLSTKKVRPYAGLGVGFSRISTPEITIQSGSQTTTIESEQKGNLGFAPRVGLMLGGFGIEFDYNLSGRTPKSVNQNVSASDKPFNFYAIRLKYVVGF